MMYQWDVVLLLFLDMCSKWCLQTAVLILVCHHKILGGSFE